MVQKTSGLPPPPQGSEILPVDDPGELQDLQFIARIANELYQELQRFSERLRK